jgi:hypothetical protein
MDQCRELVVTGVDLGAVADHAECLGEEVRPPWLEVEDDVDAGLAGGSDPRAQVADLRLAGVVPGRDPARWR